MSEKVATYAKVLILPALLGIVGAYFNYRLALEKQRSEAGYGAVAPAVKDLQEQVKVLTVKMDLLTTLIPKIVYRSNETGSLGARLQPMPAPAVATLQKFQSTPFRRLTVAPVPQSLDAAAAMKK